MDDWTVFFDNFPRAVRKRRQLNGMTQEELAKRLGLQRSYITDIERGARAITLKTAWKLATCLDLELSELITEVEKLKNSQQK